MGLTLTVKDRIATIVMDRPEALNAFDLDMRREMHAAWNRLRTDDEIWVAVITGAGDRSFSTGSDLKNSLPSSRSFASQQYGGEPVPTFLGDLHLVDKPVIAAINGYAVGGGLELALACDIRLCSSKATFALSEVKIGSIPGGGGTQRLVRAIGMSDAMLMLLSGDRIDAAEAHRIGLVSRVYEPDQLLAEATALAQRITANAPLAVRAVKRVAYQGLDVPLHHGLAMERQVFGLLYASADRIEGRKAFSEKRKPNYTAQ
ncbi:MAG: enoyl-CoA hydratase [Novosphingobium sp.]|nr:enoyl-CoA hydratase [Novosphingobium sp.]